MQKESIQKTLPDTVQYGLPLNQYKTTGEFQTYTKTIPYFDHQNQPVMQTYHDNVPQVHVEKIQLNVIDKGHPITGNKSLQQVT